MRIVFMGTPEFAAVPLSKIIEAGYDVVGVVTQEDKPRGRGDKVSYPPVKEEALKHDIEVFQPKRLRDAESIEWVRSKEPDIIIVAAYGKILPKEIIDMPEYGCINIHASLLPKLRGAAPIQQAVIDGDEYSGITIMRMDEGLDTGDILLQEAVKLAPDETGGSLHDKLMDLGGELILKALGLLEEGKLERTPQSGESSYAGMLSKQMGHIDYSKPAVEIERLIRGLAPWPSAFSYLDGKMMKIWKAEVVSDDGQDYSSRKNGEIVLVSKDSLCIKTGCDILSVKELQPAGKKRMDIGAYLRGSRVTEGTVLE